MAVCWPWDCAERPLYAGIGRSYDVAVLAVAAASFALALPPGFREAVKLEPGASFVAGKPVTVVCGNSETQWQAWLVQTYGAGTSDVGGSTAPGDSLIHLSPKACAYSLAQLHRAAKQPSIQLAAAIEILTHESIHARGEHDEAVTDCEAVHEMPRVAVKFFRVRAGPQLRALMAQAWTWRRTLPPSQTALC